MRRLFHSNSLPYLKCSLNLSVLKATYLKFITIIYKELDSLMENLSLAKFPFERKKLVVIIITHIFKRDSNYKLLKVFAAFMPRNHVCSPLGSQRICAAYKQFFYLFSLCNFTTLYPNSSAHTMQNFRRKNREYPGVNHPLATLLILSYYDLGDQLYEFFFIARDSFLMK